MKYRYTSVDTLDLLSLHDCVIENARIDGNSLALDFEWIDVLASHPLNPFDVAKCTEKASLVFENCCIKESFFCDPGVGWEAPKKALDIIELATGFEVLACSKMDTVGDSQVYMFKGEYRSGRCWGFGTFILQFDHVTVCWNELTDDAWFVHPVN